MIEVFIAVGGTIAGGCLIKGVETIIKRPKYGHPTKGGPTVSLPVPADSEEQKFAHKTRMLEKDNFPDWDEDQYTPCDCSICKPPEPLVPAERPVEIDNHDRTYIRYVDGMRFSLPNIVPHDAEVSWDMHGHYAMFRWWKPGGQQMAVKVIPTPEPQAAYVQVGARKPIQQWPSAREIRKERDRILKEKAKMHSDHGYAIHLYNKKYPPRPPGGKGGGSRASTIGTTRGKK